MILRSTYSYVVMDLSPAAYDEIRQKMLEAGYHQAVHGGMDDGRVVVDMHGIAVAREAAEEPAQDQSATGAPAPDRSKNKILGDGI